MSKKPVESAYSHEPEHVGELLSDPTVNRNEHEIYWPRFRAMLPDTAIRVLDFGCGPGNFTFELATKYPSATIVGVDREPGLFSDSQGNVTFLPWNGRLPLQGQEKFDLIVAKMVLHYLSDDELRALAANFLRLLEPGGNVAYSVPHPEDSEQYSTRKRTEWQWRNGTASISREVGSTGLTATMFHRNMGEWVQWIKRPMKEQGIDASLVIDDDIYDLEGRPKRLDIMHTQRGEEYSASLRRITEIAGMPEETPGILIDPNSPIGRELLYGDLSRYPDKPLPY
jgi:SAM-dependent methyltransferase